MDRTARSPALSRAEIPYHRWFARWRAWRRATVPGPRFDLAANLREAIAPGSDELLRRWSADLSPRERRWLDRRSSWR